MQERTCARCGTPFTLTKPNRRFCSSACQVANNRAESKQKRKAVRIPVARKTCPSCEATYTPAAPAQKWCSLKCGSRSRQREYQGLKGPQSITRSCAYCGEGFSSADGRVYYCGDECARTAKSLRESYRRYGITMEEYRALWLRQGGKCAICKKPERTQRNRLLTIDHDHQTGHIRGLLCSQCNRAIGLLQDDPKVIQAAALYVRNGRQITLITA